MSWNLTAPTIAHNTFKEAVRNKVFGSLLFFGVVLTATSSVLSQMSLHHEARVTSDLSIALSTFFAVAIAIYSLVTLFHTEIERRTIYTILSKPIGRWQFLVGKYLGVLELMAVVVALMFAGSCGIMALHGAEITGTFACAFVTLYLQVAIIAAITALFATISSPLLTGLFSTSVFVIGNLVSQLQMFRASLKEVSPPLTEIVDFLTYVLPNLESLNLSSLAAHQVAVPPSYLVAAVAYAGTYSAIALALSTLIFSRKDFG